MLQRLICLLLSLLLLMCSSNEDKLKKILREDQRVVSFFSIFNDEEVFASVEKFNGVTEPDIFMSEGIIGGGYTLRLIFPVNNPDDVDLRLVKYDYCRRENGYFSSNSNTVRHMDSKDITNFLKSKSDVMKCVEVEGWQGDDEALIDLLKFKFKVDDE